MSDIVMRPDGTPYWRIDFYTKAFPDLEAIHEQAIADGGRAAEELAPGVTRAEGEAAMIHAVVIQGGSATAEREAERIAFDRSGWPTPFAAKSTRRPDDMGSDPRPNVADGDSWAPEHQILRTTVGSAVHGMAIPGTDDNDEMGVYLEPLEYSLGLSWSKGTWNTRDVPAGVRSGPGDTDLTLYSLRHYLKLATEGNATVLTVLYAPSRSVLHMTPLGMELRALAPQIVSQRCVAAHLGYLQNQYNRMRGIGPRQNRVPNRPELVEAHGYDTKYASHAIRLGYQGLEMATTGRLTLPMSGAPLEHAMAVKRGLESKEAAAALIESLITLLRWRLDHPLLGVLPAQPDLAAVNRFMIEAQVSQLD